MFAKRDSASTSAKKRELTAYNLFVKEQMPILCAIEKNKCTSRKLPNELMVVIAKKWNQQKMAKIPVVMVANSSTQTEYMDIIKTNKIYPTKIYYGFEHKVACESSSQTTMSFPQVMANTRCAWV